MEVTEPEPEREKCRAARRTPCSTAETSALSTNTVAGEQLARPGSIIWLENAFKDTQEKIFREKETRYREAELYINEAIRSGKRIAKLARRNLFSVPANIGAFSSLKILDLENNHLTAIPSIICNLVGLHNIYLGKNKLERLPATFGNLRGLTHIYLEKNKIKTVPESFGQLTNLILLSLSENRLTRLPSSIGSLTSLRHLSVACNKLTSLPNSMENLSNLMELEVQDNMLMHIPPGVSKLQNLIRLQLQQNVLLVYPPLKVIQGFERQICRQAEKVRAYCAEHERPVRVVRHERFQTHWTLVKQVQLAFFECTCTFQKLPLEMLKVKTLFIALANTCDLLFATEPVTN